MEAKAGRTVTLLEIATEMRVPSEHLEAAIALLNPAESLDAPLGQEDGATRLDTLESSDEVGADFHESQDKRNMRLLLKHLVPLDQEILMRHFGLIDGQPETLAQIADRYGLSRERVRQRQDKALLRLQRPARKMDLFTPSTRKATR
jgi:DNA-directed RNA polymerase sigma subunit (sigma70/sigma32)